MTTAHQPTAGSPIVSVQSREVLGHWTAAAPLLYPDQRLRFTPFLPDPLRYFAEAEVSMEVVQTFDIWRTWGDPSRGHQVWLTTAPDAQHLRGLRGVRPVVDNDYAKDAEAVRRVLNMRGFPILYMEQQQYLEDFARHLEERAYAKGEAKRPPAVRP